MFVWSPECRLDKTRSQAYEELMAQSRVGIYADLLVAIDDLDMRDQLKTISMGKVIGAPTNRAMKQFYAAEGFAQIRGRFDVNQTQMKTWYRQWLVDTIALQMSWIQPAAWDERACPSKVIPVNDLTDVLASMVRVIPADFVLTAVAAAAAPSGVRSVGLADGLAAVGAATTGPGGGLYVRAAGNSEGWHDPKFSVLGQGYNVFEGFPLSFGLSSIDPGFTYQNVFSLTDDTVSALDPGTGGACDSKFSTQASYSSSSFSESTAASVGVSADFGVASFSANANYNDVKSQASSDQLITLVSKANMFMDGFALRGAPMGIALNRTFVANVAPLASQPNNQTLLYRLISNFGTHYVNKVYTGGLVSLTSTMTAASYAEMQASSYSVSVSVEVVGIGGTATIAGGSSSATAISNNSYTMGVQILPPEVTPPFLFGNFVDCVGWSQKLYRYNKVQGKPLPPVHYTLSSILTLFSFPELWQAAGAAWATSTTLNTIRTSMKNYILGCQGYNGANCIPPSTSCVAGTYQVQTPGGLGCLNCFDTNVAVGPKCGPKGTASCTANTCTCNNQYTGPRCTVSLGPPPPPPPAPPPPPLQVPPTPAPANDCFPSDAEVEVEGRGRVRLADVSLGDSVLAATAGADGRVSLAYRPIYLYPHRDPDGSALYVHLEVVPLGGGAGAGASSGTRLLRLSRRHFLPACAAGDAAACGPPALPGLLAALLPGDGVPGWRHSYARDVRPGMLVLARVGNGTAVAPARVARAWLARAPGLFNPFVQGGVLVVDGVLASDQSEWLLDDLVPPAWAHRLPALYCAALAPVRWAYAVLGARGVARVDAAVGASRALHRAGELVGAAAAGRGAPAAAAAAAGLPLLAAAALGAASALRRRRLP